MNKSKQSMIRGKLLILASDYLIFYFLLAVSHLKAQWAISHGVCPTVETVPIPIYTGDYLDPSGPPSPPRKPVSYLVMFLIVAALLPTLEHSIRLAQATPKCKDSGVFPYKGACLLYHLQLLNSPRRGAHLTWRR